MADATPDDAKQPSRSPSPAAPPPVATAPGPRARQLQTLYEQAIESITKKCNYKAFVECFPTVAEYAPATLEILHKQFTEQFENSVKKSLNTLVMEKDVIPKLNALDLIIEDALRRKRRAEEEAGGPVEAPIPLHTLDPKTLFLAHLQPFLKERHDIMQKELRKTQGMNNELMKEILAQRKRMGENVGEVEDMAKKLEESARTVQGKEIAKLGDDVRDIDMEMRNN